MASKGPAKIQNFFDFSCKNLRGEMVKFSAFKGKVVLVENVASLWGTTVRDYTQMNELVAKYSDKLVILGFPCNQFGHQVRHVYYFVLHFNGLCHPCTCTIYEGSCCHFCRYITHSNLANSCTFNKPIAVASSTTLVWDLVTRHVHRQPTHTWDLVTRLVHRCPRSVWRNNIWL